MRSGLKRVWIDALIWFPPYSCQALSNRSKDAVCTGRGFGHGNGEGVCHIRLVTSCNLGQMQKTTGRYLNGILWCQPKHQLISWQSVDVIWIFKNIKSCSRFFLIWHEHRLYLRYWKWLVLSYKNWPSVKPIAWHFGLLAFATMHPWTCSIMDYETFNASFDYRFSLLRLMSQVCPSRLF